ncbi:phage portal protein, HK97 family [Oceanobacillus picturae]|uniref:Phage portal protein, HK97 family n=1 Tax=Oceanobacillus picturae TaxID=171693 RepID=W9AKD1_9BACI|nr:phage portal protein [Oceanobacillus picturae]CDO03106.1 phage portal protein, HK97 family [Oceanobacillus picturae]
MIFKNVLTPKAETTDLKDPAPWFLKMFGHESASGETVTVNSALGVPAVYTCVNILANSIAKLPFQTFKKTRDGRERDKKHAVAKLLENRPNPYQSPFKFKHLIETHRNTWGNAYININWGYDGRPKELWLLNPSVTEPYVDVKTNTLWYLTTLPNGEFTKIGYGDVIHLTALSTDGVKGKPPIQVAREAIGSSQAAQKFKGKFYKNGASNSGVLKVPGMINSDAKEVVRDEWEKANTGLNNAQRIAILDAGLEFQSISMPLKDAQFVEGMKYDKTDIAMLYNIPMHMVNELERSTHSNIEQQSLDFIQHTLSPIIKQWEEEFTYQLFSEVEQRRYYSKFNLTSLLRADAKSRGEFYKMMWEIGGFDINQILELEDMDGIGPMGEKRFVSLNFTTLDLIEDYQRAKATVSEGGEDNETED